MTSVFLDANAEAAVKQRAAAVEKAAGVEVVAAVTARLGSPRDPWKTPCSTASRDLSRHSPRMASARNPATPTRYPTP